MAQTMTQETIKGAANPAPGLPQGSQPPVAAKPAYRTALSKVTETYTNMLIDQAKSIQIQYSEYQKTCVANCIAKMQELLIKEGLTFADVDSNNLTSTLQTVAMLQLNPAATPRECYVQLRKVKVKVETGEVDNYGNKKYKDAYVRQFEFGIEGDGNDAILRTYGVDVVKVHQCWIVREGDEFTYPSFNGLELVPPKWSPRNYTGKVLRVVYPISKKDGTVEYHIAEREGVVKNLLAHISNNMMNETFGIAENRYKANEEQLEKIESKKQELLSYVANKSLEEILNTKEIQKWISPSWLSHHSREDMILRKLRNNAVKKIPKDFKTAFAALEYEKTYEDYEQYRQEKIQADPEAKLSYEVDEQANVEPLKTNVNINPDDSKSSETLEVEIMEKPVQKPNPQPQQPQSSARRQPGF